jgi:hypothetical protein
MYTYATYSEPAWHMGVISTTWREVMMFIPKPEKVHYTKAKVYHLIGLPSHF